MSKGLVYEENFKEKEELCKAWHIKNRKNDDQVMTKSSLDLCDVITRSQCDDQENNLFSVSYNSIYISKTSTVRH